MQLGLLSNLLISSAAFAVNPVQGFYVGLLGEMSNGPSSYSIILPSYHGHVYAARINNSLIGGGGGGVLGYRYNQLLVEAEVLYNWVGSGTANVGQCTLQSPTVQTPTGNCPDILTSTQLGFNGSVAGVYGMINAYWNFINYDADWTVFPYIGAGIGAVQFKASGNLVSQYYASDYPPSIGTSRTTSTGAAQGIIGLGVFMDDFTWAGMDYRYLSSGTINGVDNIYSNKRYVINTLNFNVNLSFDKGGV